MFGVSVAWRKGFCLCCSYFVYVVHTWCRRLYPIPKIMLFVGVLFDRIDCENEKHMKEIKNCTRIARLGAEESAEEKNTFSWRQRILIDPCAKPSVWRKCLA